MNNVINQHINALEFEVRDRAPDLDVGIVLLDGGDMEFYWLPDDTALAHTEKENLVFTATVTEELADYIMRVSTNLSSWSQLHTQRREE